LVVAQQVSWYLELGLEERSIQFGDPIRQSTLRQPQWISINSNVQGARA
jgi:hypothetical protein